MAEYHSPIRARPLAEWHEDDGPCLWYLFPIGEPPYVGSPLDTDWPGYHTHWHPIPLPHDPTPPTPPPRSEVCPGYETGGTAEPCCPRSGQYNGYGSDGPLLFRCPRGCGCHD